MAESDFIDNSAPDDSHSSFRITYYAFILPQLHVRFFNVDLIYLTRIYRDIVHVADLIWRDVNC